MRNIKLGSLFDGSAGFPLAGLMYGIVPIWASEIEPYPIRVTTKRLPFMKHYGDISKMNGAEIEPVDIITGGSPCQDMSVAGKREGLSKKCPKCDYKVVGNEDITECPKCGAELEYTRSGLFMEQIRIIKEMREATNGQYPRYMVWENVPGALSSNKGEDFRCVLEETARIKDTGFNVPMPAKNKWNTAGLIMGEGFSIGWRILDAQYWGVPQRRRRIFLVADFSGTSAGEILFKREGLSWHFAESREAWQTATGNLTTGFDEAGECPAIMIENHPNDSRVKIDESGTCQSLTGRMGTGGGNVPLTMQIRAGCEGGGKEPLIQENKSATLSTHNTQTLFCMATQQGGAEIAENLSPMITAAAGMSGNNQPVICEPCIGISRTHGIVTSEELCPTIQAAAGESGNNQPMVCLPTKSYGICSYASNAMKSDNPHSGIYEANTSRTLDLNGGNHACNQGGICVCEPTSTAYSLQGNMIGRADKNGPQGNGVNENVNFTLNATDRHVVAFDRAAFNQGQNAQYDPQFYEDETTPTLIARGPNGVCYENKTYQKVTGPLMANSHPGSYTGQDAFSDMLVAIDYIVRRLIPLECARLQGFPDWWTAYLGTKEEDITDEMMDFWREVFETHRKVVSGAEKPKTDKQIKKWLMDPDNDSAEYKMWGNGVALPCVLYVMEGIADVLRKEGD